MAIAVGQTGLQAQGVTTGGLRGRVVDGQSRPIAFVEVMLTSPALLGARAAATASDGSYAFAQLPPGDYDVRFEAPRFAPATRRVRVVHAAVVELRVRLNDENIPERAAEAGPLVLPPGGPAVAAIVGHDEAEALAIPRHPMAVAQLSPGVDGSQADPDQVSIHGAFAWDNLVVLDGIDVGDSIPGSRLRLFVEDAIDETMVLTSGIAADYGRFTGGVVSAVTRSGGNRFSGSYRLNLSNPSWSRPTPLERCDPSVTMPGCVSAAPRPDRTDAAHEATLGGYLVKNRVWFFSAGGLASRADSSVLPLTNTLNTETMSDRRGQLKATGAIAQGHTLMFDTSVDQTTDADHPAFASTVDPSAVGDRRLQGYTDLANYRGGFGRRAFGEAQFSFRRLERRNTSAVGSNAADSPMLARTIYAGGSPAHYNAPYFDASDPERRDGIQATGNLTYAIVGGATGRHEIKVGYEFFRSRRTGANSQSPTGYVFNTDYLTDSGGVQAVLDAFGRFIPLWVPGQSLLETWLPVRGATLTQDTQAAFIQDHWVLGSRLSADVGIRGERARSRAAGAFVGTEGDTVMPRLGVGYDVTGRGTQIVRATYGRYAGRYDENQVIASTSVANPGVWQGVYFGPVGQGRSFAPGFDPANYLTIAGRFPSENVSILEPLQPPLVSEFTTSYTAGFLDGKGFLQAAFIHRRWSRLIEDSISIANGTTHVIEDGFNVGTFTNVVYRNTDAASRRYAAIEFQGRYQVLRGWTVSAAGTVELRNEGNYVGEADNGQPARTTALGEYPEIYTPDRHYPSGRLPGFQRSRVRLWSVYSGDFGSAGGMTLSGLVRVESPRVYSLVVLNQPLTATQSGRLVDAGYPDRPAAQTIFFGGRGSEDFAGYSVVDLALRYDVPVLRVFRPWFELEIYNAFDNQKLIAWDTTIDEDPATATDALGIASGYRKASTFGTAVTADQFPVPFPGDTGGRTFLIAAGVRF